MVLSDFSDARNVAIIVPMSVEAYSAQTFTITCPLRPDIVALSALSMLAPQTYFRPAPTKPSLGMVTKP